MSVSTQHPAQPSTAGPVNAPHGRIRARRRTVGASIGAIPVANIVLIEVGLALGLILVLINPILLPVAGGVAGVAFILAILRKRGRWFTQWLGLVFEYRGRAHTRISEPVISSEDEDYETASKDSGREDDVIGPENTRVSLLRLAVPDLVVARSRDHDRNMVGMAWHEGKWTAVLMVEPTPSLINPLGGADGTNGGAEDLPLSVLGPCLEDRGVVLDAIQVIWHCYPGSTHLPNNSPALNSYLEVLDPLPAAARRTTWVAVRLDPKHCAKAIGERGGGVVGAHRALIGALSRVRNALEQQGVPTRPLDPDELLQAGITSAELQGALGSEHAVGLKEEWDNVTAAHVGHASFSVTGWPSHMKHSLNDLTRVRALSSTIALSISPCSEEGLISLRGIARVSARTPDDLSAASDRLKRISNRIGVTLTPLKGSQLAGFTTTLPLGGAA